jgi:hypothetical protein
MCPHPVVLVASHRNITVCGMVEFPYDWNLSAPQLSSDWK